MAFLDWIIPAAREQALQEDIFDYKAFEDYREVSLSELQVDAFYVDEMQNVLKDHRIQFSSVAIAFGAAIAFYYAAFLTWNSAIGMTGIIKNIIFLTVPTGFLIVGVIMAVLLVRRGKDLDNTQQRIEALQRGVVLHKFTVYRDAVATITKNTLQNDSYGHPADAHKRVAKYTFYSIFFPDEKTYVRHVYYAQTVGRASFSFGDKVIVYKLASDPEATLLPTIHVDVPEDLMEKAKAIREALGIADRRAVSLSRGEDGAYVAEPVTKQTGKKVMNGYVLLLIIFFGMALVPLIAFGLLLLLIWYITGDTPNITFGSSSSILYLLSLFLGQ